MGKLSLAMRDTPRRGLDVATTHSTSLSPGPWAHACLEYSGRPLLANPEPSHTEQAPRASSFTTGALDDPLK